MWIKCRAIPSESIGRQQERAGEAPGVLPREIEPAAREHRHHGPGAVPREIQQTIRAVTERRCTNIQSVSHNQTKTYRQKKKKMNNEQKQSDEVLSLSLASHDHIADKIKSEGASSRTRTCSFDSHVSLVRSICASHSFRLQLIEPLPSDSNKTVRSCARER